MTKQQQQKIDKVNKALELMSQGRTIRDVYEEVGYSRWDKLKRAMIELGYIELDGKWVLSNTDSNTNSMTNGSTESNTQSNTAVKVVKKQGLRTTAEQMAVLQLMEQEQDTLKQMLAWYKKMSHTGSHTDGSTFIRVEIPHSENVMISARSNKVVWEQFKEFAKKHSANFKMGDLLAQALKDYMEKYQ